jgi:acetyl esterase
MIVRLDPAVRALLDDADPDAPPLAAMALDELRAAIAGMQDWQGPATEVAAVEDRTVPGPDGPVPVRIYRARADGPRPLVLFTHGGGWMTGSLDIVDRPARLLACATGGVLVSVGYRLAPEHRFPRGLEDAYAALEWVAGAAEELGADPAFTVVAGDSSGGNFAAALALLARDRGGPRIDHQLLVYPVLDRDFTTPSYETYADGYFLTRAAMELFWASYLESETDAASPYAAPLRAADLAGLPPATLLVCEPDPLCSEGEAYADRLAAAGVPVTLTRFPDLVHGAFWMAGVTPRARTFVLTAGHAVRVAYAVARE